MCAVVGEGEEVEGVGGGEGRGDEGVGGGKRERERR